MSVSKSGVVDFVGTDRASGDVVLTISDHLGWGESVGEHNAALQAKLESYLLFLETGQILEDYPQAEGRRIRIEILQKYAPDEEGEAWLDAARADVARRGYELSWRVPPFRTAELSEDEAG